MATILHVIQQCYKRPQFVISERSNKYCDLNYYWWYPIHVFIFYILNTDLIVLIFVMPENLCTIYYDMIIIISFSTQFLTSGSLRIISTTSLIELFLSENKNYSGIYINKWHEKITIRSFDLVLWFTIIHMKLHFILLFIFTSKLSYCTIVKNMPCALKQFIPRA